MSLTDGTECCGAIKHCAWPHLYCYNRTPKEANVDAMRAFSETPAPAVVAKTHPAKLHSYDLGYCNACGETGCSFPRDSSAVVPRPAPALKSPNPKDAIGATKPQLHLVPPSALIHMAKVFELGAKKYGAYNWRGNAINMTVYISAAMRHLVAMLDGQTTDPESGEPHAAHVAACMAIILDAGDTGNLIDDRPEPGPAAGLIEQLTVKKA